MIFLTVCRGICHGNMTSMRGRVMEKQMNVDKEREEVKKSHKYKASKSSILLQRGALGLSLGCCEKLATLAMHSGNSMFVERASMFSTQTERQS